MLHSSVEPRLTKKLGKGLKFTPVYLLLFSLYDIDTENIYCTQQSMLHFIGIELIFTTIFMPLVISLPSE